MKKVLICLAVCLVFTAVYAAKAAALDDNQSFANFLEIYGGESGGEEHIFANGTKEILGSNVTRYPFTAKFGNPLELMFYQVFKESNGNEIKSVLGIMMSGATILQKRYFFTKDAPAADVINKSFLENQLTASMVAYEPACDVKFLQLGEAIDQFITNSPECDNACNNPATGIMNCTGSYYIQTSKDMYSTFKQSRVTTWPVNFQRFLKNDKPCGY
ncbi:uncharacterized protein LOC131927604 isoform X1 [Physella acuta]|uniref:uncharacterized protein LOC131927604 isoform X1 n=1 Tax=Physella acuta TaxID=109671 RepID=UPI0027DD17D4|nr:uncharacterized protein LOC131927604 isoform X1 [Physella acuta]